MDKEQLRKYRCVECGHICWTRKSRGCRKCGSLKLEHFVEPRNYEKHRRLVHEISFDLASLAKNKEKGYLENAAHQFIELLIKPTDNLSTEHPFCKGLFGELSTLLSSWINKSIETNEVIQGILFLGENAVEYDDYLAQLIHAELSNWLSSLSSNIPKSQQDVYIIVDSRNLLTKIFSGEDSSISPKDIGLTAKDESLLSQNISKFIKDSGGTITLQCAEKLDGQYARLPFNYHINVKESAWKLLQDSVKLVPVIILLARAELPHFAEAVGVLETIKTLISNIKRLREVQGEVCVYQAIISCKKELKKYPSLKEIEEYMKNYGCLLLGCKFFKERKDGCTLKSSDLEAITSFLKDQKIIRKVSADEWWVSF
jgi:predicted  nucleic acid-binding Zn-ribbon protein